VKVHPLHEALGLHVHQGRTRCVIREHLLLDAAQVPGTHVVAHARVTDRAFVRNHRPLEHLDAAIEIEGRRKRTFDLSECPRSDARVLRDGHFLLGSADFDLRLERAAERRVAAAFYRVHEAQAARLPRIALTASGGRSTSELLRLAGTPAGFWQAGVDMLAPIFTGGALKAQVDLASADQRAALALYGQTALRAFSEVEGALASEQLLADRERYLESVLAQDTDAVRLSRLRYDVGATDLLHVLQLQSRQLDSRFELINVRNDRLANRVALHLALGGGFTPPPPTP